MFGVNMTFISSSEVKKCIFHECLRHSWIIHLYAPPPKKWRGIMLYPLKFWVSVHPSVRLSICPSVRQRPTICVPATPPTVLGQSFSNFTGAFRMVWRYAYCFFRIMKLFFNHIFFIFNLDFFPSICLSVCPSVRQRPPPFVCPQLLLQF